MLGHIVPKGKILYVADFVHPVVITLAKGFVKNGNQVTILTTTQTKGAEREEIIEGVKYIYWYSTYSRYFRQWKAVCNPFFVYRLNKFIKLEKPNLVHFHLVHHFFSYSAVKLANILAKKTFFTFHDLMSVWEEKLDRFIDFNNKSIPTKFDYRLSFWTQLKYGLRTRNPFRNFFIRKLLKGTKLFAVSNTLKQALEQNGIKNIDVLYNGIDLNKYNVDSDKILEWKKNNNLGNCKIIFAGGRLSSAKGFDHLVDAFKIISEKNFSVKLVIIGKGSINYTLNLNQKICKLKLEDDIKIFESLPHENFLEAIAASDIVVVPSVYLDPLPTITLEAMAFKKPVIGSCFGGVPEIVIDNKTGYIMNPVDIATLADKILKILSDKTLAENFGEAGRVRIEDFFSLEKQLNDLGKEYF